MRVVANWTSENGGFTKGDIYNLTELGCADDYGYNYVWYTEEEGNNLLEKWNNDWKGSNFESIFTEVKEDTMKKSDLITGLHAVELRNGSFYIVVGNQLLSNCDWMELEKYNDDLYFFAIRGDYDIVKIYKHNTNFNSGLGNGFLGLDKTKYKLLWERETEQQKQIKELKKIIEDAANKIREIEGE